MVWLTYLLNTYKILTKNKDPIHPINLFLQLYRLTTKQISSMSHFGKKGRFMLIFFFFNANLMNIEKPELQNNTFKVKNKIENFV